MKKTILIVEDERFLVDMYALKLESEGFHVLTASDGLDALEVVNSNKVDLILLDLVMPRMDGYRFLDELRAMEKGMDISVCILSNLGQTDEIKKGIEKSVKGYLVKASLTPSQLVDHVKDMLNGKFVGLKRQLMKKAAMEREENKKKEKKRVNPEDTKVLLIEDHQEIIDMYVMKMNQIGYLVEVAKNGAWGLKLAKQKKFDIIVMDMVMPAMHGYEMLAQIKKDSLNVETPIIVLSNSAQDQEIQNAYEKGVDRYLIKSNITPTKLVNEIYKLLTK